jgi:hypothetical protein
VRELPELFELRVKARSLAYLFLAGAGLGMLTLALPHSDLIEDRQLIILAAVASAMALAMWVWADRVRTWHLHVALAAGTIILSFANYFVEATVLYPLMYTWTALFAFYFFRLEIALAHVALIAVCYAIVLVIVEPMSPVVLWLLAVATRARRGPRRFSCARPRRRDHVVEQRRRTALRLDGSRGGGCADALADHAARVPRAPRQAPP